MIISKDYSKEVFFLLLLSLLRDLHILAMQHQIHVYLFLIIYFQLNLKFLLQHDKLQLNVDILEQLFEFLIEPK